MKSSANNLMETSNVHTGVRPPHFEKSVHHYHNWYEIFIVTKGQCRFTIGEKSYELSDFDVILLSPGKFHYYESDLGCDYSVIEFSIGYLNKFYSPEAIEQLLLCFNEPTASLDDKSLKLCLEYMEIVDNKNSSSSMTKLLALGEILNLFSANVPHAKKTDDNKKKSSFQKLNPIINYIGENFKEIASIDDLAKHCYISKSHLFRLFNQELGLSVSAYINNVKISEARKLMETTKMSLLDISLECGFNSPQYFYKIFRSRMGCTPKEYVEMFVDKSE